MPAYKSNYRKDTEVHYLEKTKIVLNELPQYCKNFIHSKATVYEPSSQYRYAVDLRIFLRYLKKSNPLCAKLEIKDIPAEILEQLDHTDFDEYIAYLSCYEDNGTRYRNGKSTIKSKIAAVKLLYRYMFKENYISRNAAELIDTPKLPKKEIIYMTQDEKMQLIHAITNPDLFAGSKKQIEIHKQTMLRDKAIVLLFLGTGIRNSELIGLDMDDVDLEQKKINVIRRGNKEDHVYFNDMVKAALLDYLGDGDENRPGTRASYGKAVKKSDENALFLSRKRNRLSPNSIEVMIKKYVTSVFGEGTKFTPHKLRSTFGSELYKKSGDIKLVADTLGYSSIETTQRFFSAKDDNKMRMAADFIDL